MIPKVHRLRSLATTRRRTLKHIFTPNEFIMIKKCLIIKHSAFANSEIVTAILSKFYQFASLDLDYRQIALNFSQIYRKQGIRQLRCTCWGFQKSLASLAALERRQKRRKRIEQLLFLRSRLKDWQIGFLNSILLERKLSKKQLDKLAEIESKVGGLK